MFFEIALFCAVGGVGNVAGVFSEGGDDIAVSFLLQGGRERLKLDRVVGAVVCEGRCRETETDALEIQQMQPELTPYTGPEITAPSAILMEASTETVICEKNADEPRNPASVTKIMTLILIFDALQSGKIRLTDEVVTSAYAKSMGGSRVFLEEGEVNDGNSD